ncbi:MAG TPA: hypothetical protein VIV40_39430 [Kofleriaceae bacterium]
MFAAALLPLLFIAGLVFLFVIGAWPFGAFVGALVIALLLASAVALMRMNGRQVSG